MNDKNEKTFVHILGHEKTGKTACAYRLTDIGLSNFSKIEPNGFLDFYNNKDKSICYFDHSEQAIKRNFNLNCIKKDVFLVLVFDITSKVSFEELNSYTTRIKNQNATTLVLIGNKSDLESERKVKIEEAEALAAKLGVTYIETSAQNNTGFEKVKEVINAGIAKSTKHKPKIKPFAHTYKNNAPQLESKTTNDPCYDFILNALINLTIILTGIIPYLLFCLAMNKNYNQENKEVRGSYFKFYGAPLAESDDNLTNIQDLISI